MIFLAMAQDFKYTRRMREGQGVEASFKMPVAEMAYRPLLQLLRHHCSPHWETCQPGSETVKGCFRGGKCDFPGRTGGRDGETT